MKTSASQLAPKLLLLAACAFNITCVTDTSSASPAPWAPSSASPLSQAAQPAPAANISKEPAPFKQPVPATAFSFEMLPIPGDEAKGIKPFYMAKTELTWEAFDVWVYSLDAPQGTQPEAIPGNGGGGEPDPSAAPPAPDAITRPSKPYLPPDRGFGHEGFAVICITHKSAIEYCKWLSEKTGRTYQLATRAQWQHAAHAGANPQANPETKESEHNFTFGAPEGQLLDYAWLRENSDEKPHPVGTKKPNAWGLHDMIGNVQEWVINDDGKPVTVGGSYRTPAADISIDKFAKNNPAWSASDPQVPKSPWWLADGPFVGFRVVCTDAPSQEHNITKDPQHPPHPQHPPK
jgi:formylglycine-generating enzyme required for sulfatase activity